jgi:hypothetical protein
MFDPSSNVRADARLKQLVLRDEQAADDLWEFRHPADADGKVIPYSEIRVQIPLRYGFTISHASLLEFYRWLELKRKYDHAAALAAQAREQRAQENADLSDEDLDRYADRVFKSECLKEGNVKGYVSVRKVQLAEKAVENDSRRIRLLEDSAAAAKAKIEAAASKAKSLGGISEETLKELEEAAKLL